jgi:hypothetical protein
LFFNFNIKKDSKKKPGPQATTPSTFFIIKISQFTVCAQAQAQQQSWKSSRNRASGN